MAATSISLDTERLSRLVGLGYEAPVGLGDEASREREAWRLFTQEAAEVFGCQLAMVEYLDGASPQDSFVATGGLDGFEELFTVSRTRSQADTYWAAMHDQPAGTVQLGSDIVHPAVMHQTSLYSSVAMPWQLEHFLIGSIQTGDGVDAFFTLGRTARERPFVAGDKSLISRMLLTHLNHSMTMHRELALARGTRDLLSAVMRQAPTGIVVFNVTGEPIVVNDKATNMFAMADGLTLADGRLRATEPAAQVQLDLALAATLRTATGLATSQPISVLAPRPPGQRPYRVTFSTLGPPGERTGFPRGSVVVALIHDERRASGLGVSAALRATYGLTRAEVRLCERLLAGQSLAEAATALGVSRNTTKTHLARIFDKTGVRSQMALLRLLALGARA
ncbi:MAG: helix-turn-helix transcriptional regulator [Gammaproteobacteria bacterium]